MAEEAQAPECNENENPEIIPVEITDVLDQVDTSIIGDTSQCDSVLTSGSPDILLEEKISNPSLDLNDKNEEARKGENSITLEKGPDVLDNHEKEFEENKEGGCQTRVDGDTAPSPEDITKQDKDGDKTPDILLYQQSHHSSETGTEDTETEEENTSIETDTEYGDGSYDEPSLGVTGSYEMCGNTSDIPMNSCSRYDTVSYRKIRKGNTKQRIDEFESMMNL